MKTLVTGGAGFIGSHLVDYYITNGDSVVVFDDLSTGVREQVNGEAVFVEGDIANKEAVTALFADHGPFDIINHHAAQKSVTRSVADPAEDANINIVGSLHLMEQAAATGCHHIIFPSTGGVIYGAEVPMPAVEDAKVKPISPYGIAKYSVEHYLRYYEGQDLIGKVLRYGNVYGPRQDPHGEAGVVAIFCQRILNNQPMTIYGDGTQTRDFIYIEDIIKANAAAPGPDHGGVWNIGCGLETSINEIAEQLRAIAERRGYTVLPIEYQPARPGELQRSSIDVSLAKDQLTWEANVSLVDGLEQTFASFESVAKGEN